jgi:hypothetical protein
MSDDTNAGDVVAVPADQAPYPPRQVWAAALSLASAIDQIDLDRAEDEIRAAYYGNAEDALIAARDAAPPVLQEETGTRELAVTPELLQRLVEISWRGPAVCGIGGTLSDEELRAKFAEALAPASPSGETGGQHRVWCDVWKRTAPSRCTCAAAPPAGETRDGRELREFTLTCPKGTDRWRVRIPEAASADVAEGWERIRVREIPSEGAPSDG